MLLINPIVRAPKESEMSLSSQVKDSVNQAAGILREALAFAARTEHPVTISSLTDILVRLESLEQMDDLMSSIGNQRNLPNNFNNQK